MAQPNYPNAEYSPHTKHPQEEEEEEKNLWGVKKGANEAKRATNTEQPRDEE